MPEKTPKVILAQNVRRIRRETGFSQEDLADRAGLHRTYISSIERGERNISLENLFLLADALGVDSAVLVTPPPESEDG